MDYLRLDNEADGFKEVPVPATPVPEDFLADIRAAVAELPPRVQERARKRATAPLFKQ